ncbi:putative ankyrin repeat protein RF_0381 [Acropora millepora]|uniref:putative ankyrin repeat protein RF_0381 n=1 Tax=Acropora millepora TaxID=45264 RepID=UPI0010FC7762|nr:putative ankyrin repeat protein RF_0381 [Acropora millepora]
MEIKAPSGNTALHAAVHTGNISMVQTLINAGAKVNACNAECECTTPLHLAIMGGNSEMVSATLEVGCDKNAKMGIPATLTPLNLATEFNP